MRVVAQRIERRQPFGGAERPIQMRGERDRAVDRDHDRTGEREQRIVELDDGRPVGPAIEAPRRVRRLHCGFELEAPGRAQAAGAQKQRLRLLDECRIPVRRVLRVQRHELALRIAPRLAARLGVQRQREQSQRLGLLRQQRCDQAREPDPLLRQAAAARLRAGRIGPALRVDGVDRLQHGIKSRGELVALRHAERNPGLPDPVLRAHQALAHGRWGDQERRGDRRGVEAEHRLQHQRRAHAGVDRRMRAGEHQPQALVGNPGLCACIVDPVRQQRQRRFRLLPHAPAPRGIDELAPGHRQQPGFGHTRDPAARPIGERLHESLGQRVLRPRDVARARSEKGDQLAVARARHCLRGLRYITQTGRTSMAPCCAPGQRAAHASAASRSGASIR